MNDVLIIVFWEKGDDIFSRPMLLDKKLKKLKLNGRSPVKIIVPESASKRDMSKVKKLAGCKTKIIVALNR